jgi:hypothetical protein
MSTDFGTSMPTKSEEESIPSDGGDVALFGIGGVDVSGIAFVGINGSLQAGHAAEAQC